MLLKTKKNFKKLKVLKSIKVYKKINNFKLLNNMEKIYRQKMLFKTAKQWEKIKNFINPYNLFNFSFNYKTLKQQNNNLYEKIEIVIFKTTKLKKINHKKLQSKYLNFFKNN